MLRSDKSVLLAPDFFLIVRWSARIIDFMEEWEERQALAHSKDPLEFWSEAAGLALEGVEQGQHQVQQLLASTYRLSGLLPVPGDILLLDSLEIRVDQRHFTMRPISGTEQAEVIIYIGVERYRYANVAVPGKQQKSAAFTSSTFESMSL